MPPTVLRWGVSRASPLPPVLQAGSGIYQALGALGGTGEQRRPRVQGQHQPHLEPAGGFLGCCPPSAVFPLDPGDPIHIYYLNRKPESNLQSHPLGNHKFTAMKGYWEETERQRGADRNHTEPRAPGDQFSGTLSRLRWRRRRPQVNLLSKGKEVLPRTCIQQALNQC